MEAFRWTYLQLCKEAGVEPQESVVAQLQQSGGAPISRLDLSGQSLTTGTCTVLSRALQSENVFTEVSLSDCMLTEEGTTLLSLEMFFHSKISSESDFPFRF